MDTGGSANEQGLSPVDWAASDSTCIHLKEERERVREGEEWCVCAWMEEVPTVTR